MKEREEVWEKVKKCDRRRGSVTGDEVEVRKRGGYLVICDVRLLGDLWNALSSSFDEKLIWKLWGKQSEFSSFYHILRDDTFFFCMINMLTPQQIYQQRQPFVSLPTYQKHVSKYIKNLTLPGWYISHSVSNASKTVINMLELISSEKQETTDLVALKLITVSIKLNLMICIISINSMHFVLFLSSTKESDTHSDMNTDKY